MTKRGLSAMVFPVTFRGILYPDQSATGVENGCRISLNAVKKRRCQKNERTAYPQGC